MVDVGYNGFFDCVSKTVNAGGISALFNGGGARVAWLMPFTAIYLPVYEIIKRKLSETNSANKALNVKGGAQVTPIAETINQRLVESCYKPARVGLQRGIQLIDNARCSKYI